MKKYLSVLLCIAALCASAAAFTKTISAGTAGEARQTEISRKQVQLPLAVQNRKYYCKYCGASAPTITALTLGTCPRHPDSPGKGHHEPYMGSPKSRYTCKYCGASAPSITGLTLGLCPRHPKGAGKGHHMPFEGD
jgi:ribosomal protein L37AE/L43A